MASLIPGYEYDIFISYRQKDNKHDGWVTEFVNNLKGELESTFKEEISVYFDINPHDGLLETHDVNASLKEKLKCLIFIPIISRTYCDPKSFAWEHEFKAFVELASKDQFGLKIKLPSGNVASRVLPIRIYDLDDPDTRLCESVLGNVLRGVEFIYAEPGVNRPLRASEDNPNDNLNHTIYRNQINKVGNATREIISGFKTGLFKPVKEKIRQRIPSEEVRKEGRKEEQEKPIRLTKNKLLSGVLITSILVITGILIYPTLFKRDTLDNLRSSGERISVVVMPFQNMTNDTTWNIWQYVIQTNITTFLSNNPEELKVRQTELISEILQSKGLTDYHSFSSSVLSSISEKLDVDVLISGSINLSGSTLRLNAQLLDVRTIDVLKSFQVDGTVDNKLLLIDSLKVMLNSFLVISKLGKEFSPDFLRFTSGASPEAFRYFIAGQNAFNERNWSSAGKLYSQAIDNDSNFAYAYTMISMAYLNQGFYDQAKKYAHIVYQRKPHLTYQQKLMADWINANCSGTPQEAISCAKQLLEIDDQSPNYHFILGMGYLDLYQYERAIPAYEKALEIFDRWSIKPSYTGTYSHLGPAYHKTGQYEKEKKLYERMGKDFPDNPDLLYNKAVLALAEGDTVEATILIERLKSVRKDLSWSEARIITNVASIYYEARYLDTSEKYYRLALFLEPENPNRLNSLALFLFDTKRNLKEGSRLIEKALKLSPDDYELLDTKGWGLYKEGKYQEALELLQKSWDLRRDKAVYNHEAFLHLEAAKQAVAGERGAMRGEY